MIGRSCVLFLQLTEQDEGTDRMCQTCDTQKQKGKMNKMLRFHDDPSPQGDDDSDTMCGWVP